MDRSIQRSINAIDEFAHKAATELPLAARNAADGMVILTPSVGAAQSAIDDLGRSSENTARAITNQVSTAISDLGGDLAELVTEGGTAKDALQAFEKAIIRLAGEEALGFLISQLGVLLTKLTGIEKFKDIFSGGGGLFGGGGGGGSGGGGGGKKGIPGFGGGGDPVTGAISAASNVGTFLGVRQVEGSLNVIEMEVRQSKELLRDLIAPTLFEQSDWMQAQLGAEEIIRDRMGLLVDIGFAGNSALFSIRDSLQDGIQLANLGEFAASVGEATSEAVRDIGHLVRESVRTDPGFVGEEVRRSPGRSRSAQSPRALTPFETVRTDPGSGGLSGGILTPFDTVRTDGPSTAIGQTADSISQVVDVTGELDDMFRDLRRDEGDLVTEFQKLRFENKFTLDQQRQLERAAGLRFQAEQGLRLGTLTAAEAADLLRQSEILGEHRLSRIFQETALEPPVGSHQVSRVFQETAHFPRLDHLTTAIPKTAPTDGTKGAALIPIFEIDLGGETLRFSSEGVPTDAGQYESRVVSWGSFPRELPEQSGEFRVSEGQITLQNADNRWGILRATTTIYESFVRIKVGDPSGPVADFTTIYTGTVTNWEITPTEVSLTITDPWTRFLHRVLFIPITKFTFPFLPDSTPSGGMVPIAAGIHATSGSERKGALPAYLIDPTFTHIVLGANKFRYVACQGKIEGITAVYVYGELAAEGAGNDYVWDDEDEENLFAVPDTVNYITFNADPRLGLGGTIPAGADTSVPEVTFDVKGLVDEGGAMAMENPAQVLRFVLEKHAQSFTEAVLGLQTIEESINKASVTAATLAFQRNNLKIALFVTRCPDHCAGDSEPDIGEHRPHAGLEERRQPQFHRAGTKGGSARLLPWLIESSHAPPFRSS